MSALVSRVRTRWGGDLRVLLYHRVEPRPRGDDPYSLSPEALARHVAIARRLGYEVVGLDRAAGWPARRHRRELLIVFDDGYRSVLEHAAPILLRTGATAGSFLVPEAMGGTSDWERAFGLRPSPILTWQEARELVSLGFGIGAHGWDHRDLTLLSDAELSGQAREAKATIEHHTGREAVAFSVPFGRDDRRMDRHLIGAGYRVKITNQLASLSRANGLLSVPCTEIVQMDSDDEVLRKLVGAYDWLAPYHRLRGRYPYRTPMAR